MPHLWEIETHWFYKSKHEYVESTFPYKSWKDFLDCKPYKLWKPYILSSWSWKTIFPKEYTATKQNETYKTVMDCSKMLRIHPSTYDEPSVFAEGADTNGVEMLQIVFLSPDRFTGVHRVEIIIQKEDEDLVKDWLQRHMPNFWKLDS